MDARNRSCATMTGYYYCYYYYYLFVKFPNVQGLRKASLFTWVEKYALLVQIRASILIIPIRLSYFTLKLNISYPSKLHLGETGTVWHSSSNTDLNPYKWVVMHTLENIKPIKIITVHSLHLLLATYHANKCLVNYFILFLPLPSDILILFLQLYKKNQV